LEPLAHDFPSRLAAFPVRNVLWSDWGSATRVMEILRKIGYASRLNALAHTVDETEPRKNRHRAFAPSVKRHDRAEEELSFASGTQFFNEL
jgi:hypothetical protein